MGKRTIGLIAGIIALTSTGLHYVLNRGVGWLESTSTLPSWLPIIETFGTTVTLAHITVDVLVAGVPLTLAIGFGYYLGHRIDVAGVYSSLVTAVGVGSTLGVLLGLGILWTQTITSPLESLGDVLLIGGMFLRFWINFAFLVTLGIFTGATFAHFRTDDQSPIYPTEATAEPRSEQDTDSGTAEVDSEPTR